MFLLRGLEYGPSTRGLAGFATSRDIRSATYLKVPTPPASRISEVSFNGLPVQRMANARRMCPCATTRTSPFGWSGFSKQGRWYFSLISVIRASRRRTTSSGDLEAMQKLARVFQRQWQCPRQCQTLPGSTLEPCEICTMKRLKSRGYTHSPPGHPSVQIFQGPSPLSSLKARICLLVNPSYSP